MRKTIIRHLSPAVAMAILALAAASRDANAQTTAADWHETGIKLFQAHRYKEAADAINRAIALNPNNPHYYNNLFVVYDSQVQLDAAMNVLRREYPLAVRLNDADVWFHMGNNYKSLHDVDDAVAAYRRSLQLRPNFPDCQHELAMAQNFQRQVAAAAKAAPRGNGLNYSVCSGPYALAACKHSQFARPED